MATNCCGPSVAGEVGAPHRRGGYLPESYKSRNGEGNLSSNVAAMGHPVGKAEPCCGPGLAKSSQVCGRREANGKKDDVRLTQEAAGDFGSRIPQSNGIEGGEPVDGGAAVTHEDVSDYYGKQVKQQEDLLTTACLIQGEESREARRLTANVHPEILRRFYGCGSPIPLLLEGTTVLDLGCGTGRDVYVAAQLVGEHGKVIGIDMTDEQLAVAEEYREWHRARFGFQTSNVVLRKAFMEDLAAAGVSDSSVDVVISNCVVNLAPDKAPVLREVARVLKPGGELYFSDVFADRRVPAHLQRDKVLFGECLSGALYVADFRRLMARVGLGAWGIVTQRKMSVTSPAIEEKLGDITFYSLTVRAIKTGPADVEDAPEDYGQVATYKGTIPGTPDEFKLDAARVFATGAATPVDSTTAAMLGASRYGGCFEITGKGAHRGAFKGWTGPIASLAGAVWHALEDHGVAATSRCC